MSAITFVMHSSTNYKFNCVALSAVLNYLHCHPPSIAQTMKKKEKRKCNLIFLSKKRKVKEA